MSTTTVENPQSLSTNGTSLNAKELAPQHFRHCGKGPMQVGGPLAALPSHESREHHEALSAPLAGRPRPLGWATPDSGSGQALSSLVRSSVREARNVSKNALEE